MTEIIFKSNLVSDFTKDQAELKRHLYKQILYLRQCEKTLASLYTEQEMRTPTHFGIGQEAVAVGICEALVRQDVVYSHHRCHNHYLAKGGDLTSMIAELYGREGGCSRGRGGSVHLTDRSQGFIISSAILAQTIAVATGSALAFKMDDLPYIAVCFFGDAACEEGAFYESINYASIHKLPVLYICENNLYSTESPLHTRQPEGTELCERIRSFKVESNKVDGNNVYAVYNAAISAISKIRGGQGPSFIECMTYRWCEHVGPNFDHDLNRVYRSKAEFEEWILKCPVKNAGQYLIEQELATGKELETWLMEVEHKVQQAVTEAKESTWPHPSRLFDNIL